MFGELLTYSLSPKHTQVNSDCSTQLPMYPESQKQGYLTRP